MAKFIIKGGNKLAGEIPVKGAKNAALKIIPASILSDQEITIKNLPQIEDVAKSLELIKELGAAVTQTTPNEVKIKCDGIKGSNLNPELAGKFRASVMFAGPLLAKTGEAIFPFPGGCNLASGSKRPINFFLDGFEKMGAQIENGETHYKLKAKKLKGCEFFFPIVSVTATESLMMTAVLAQGKTVLKNCAMEPEIPALADYLNSQGAKIKGAGTPTIEIEGVNEINAGDFSVIPDRIETGSFAIMAATTKSELTITNCNPNHIEALLAIFDQIGISYEKTDTTLKIKKAEKFTSYNLKTHEYPGFPTDLQSPFTVLMTQAHGISLIHETIYDRRLLFTDMLMQMGADITLCDPHRVVISGPTPLYGKKLVSPDLRAGITLMIAALIAEGETQIDNIYQIERGYEGIDERLKAIGADIKKTN